MTEINYCRQLLSKGNLFITQYRIKDGSYKRRKLTIDSLSSGEFLGSDDYYYIYKGTYSGNTLEFTMRKDSAVLKGLATCTLYGAIGRKEYIQGGNGEKYLFTWRDPNDFVQ